jgi:uncharacterized SAM-binding protein YcdF (DUF218 family)
MPKTSGRIKRESSTKIIRHNDAKMRRACVAKNRGEHGGIIFRFLSLLFFLAVLALLFVFRHPLMRFAGEMWVLNEPPASSDAILVLGDDNYTGDRAFRAADLYRQNLAPQVVASGRMLRPQSGMADLIAQDLERYGVPASSITKSPYETDSLRAQADALKALVASRGWKRLLIVTSNYDTRRARLVFQDELPADIAIRLVAAPDRDFDPPRWWQSHTGQKIFLAESADYLAARIEEWRR